MFSVPSAALSCCVLSWQLLVSCACHWHACVRTSTLCGTSHTGQWHCVAQVTLANGTVWHKSHWPMTLCGTSHRRIAASTNGQHPQSALSNLHRHSHLPPPTMMYINVITQAPSDFPTDFPNKFLSMIQYAVLQLGENCWIMGEGREV
jgi:hypothetical protein